MEAIILAGGFGTRLRDVIGEIPKPMSPINGTPFLTIILNQLQKAKFSKIVLAVGYKYQYIMDYYGKKYMNMEIDYSIEEYPLGTGGCIKKDLQKTADNYIFIINGDTFFDVDFDKVPLPENLLIVCKKVDDTTRYGRIIISNGLIQTFSEKGLKGSGIINGGIYLIRRNLMDSFLLPERFSLENDFFTKYSSVLKIQTYVSNAYFIDIGIPEDYKRAQTELQ